MAKKVQDIKVDKLKVLVYGKSGGGKTAFAGTFPKPYFFDTDNGMLTLRKSTNEIDFDTYNDPDLLRPTAIRAIEKKVGEIQKENQYETIIVDSLTTVSEFAMNQVLAINGRAKATPQQQDWLQQMNWLRNFIATLLSLPVHVVFVAHEQIIQDESLGTLQALPLVTGKMAAKLPLYFDEVYVAQAVSKGKETEYRLLTKASSIYVAKSRLGCLEIHESPTFGNIIKKAKEEK